MIRGFLLTVSVVFTMSPVCARSQGMDWDKLPEPKHLSRVLDADAFLGKNNARTAKAGSRYVQVGAFHRHERASTQAKQVKAAGLVAIIGREAGRYLVLMPETKRNTADTLAAWARRSGYPDAYIRVIR
ncbi:SPOR domain-containing protein [Brucella intermedia]|uniref:SPOR domain-containing protein n=1 Tax=Brucella intermedia TaxID=94625 RepID=UPI0023608862|nr:SPOR domain-containing protein [Brucella intermedia]